jgi:hypothetical protein
VWWSAAAVDARATRWYRAARTGFEARRAGRIMERVAKGDPEAIEQARKFGDVK